MKFGKVAWVLIVNMAHEIRLAARIASAEKLFFLKINYRSIISGLLSIFILFNSIRQTNILSFLNIESHVGKIKSLGFASDFLPIDLGKLWTRRKHPWKSSVSSLDNCCTHTQHTTSANEVAKEAIQAKKKARDILREEGIYWPFFNSNSPS